MDVFAFCFLGEYQGQGVRGVRVMCCALFHSPVFCEERLFRVAFFCFEVSPSSTWKCLARGCWCCSWTWLKYGRGVCSARRPSIREKVAGSWGDVNAWTLMRDATSLYHTKWTNVLRLAACAVFSLSNFLVGCNFVRFVVRAIGASMPAVCRVVPAS